MPQVFAVEIELTGLSEGASDRLAVAMTTGVATHRPVGSKTASLRNNLALAPGLFWPAVLAVGLAGTLAWEIGEWANPVAIAHAINRPALAAAVQPEQTPNDVQDKVRDMTDHLLARPLFDASRQPASQPTATPPSHVLPRLAGLMVGPSGTRALLAQASGPMIVARLGDVVGDYVIKSIDHNELMLAGPEGDHLLHLSFARQEPEVQGTTEPAPPQPPRPKAVFIPGITPGFPLLPSSRLTKGRSG